MGRFSVLAWLGKYTASQIALILGVSRVDALRLKRSKRLSPELKEKAKEHEARSSAARKRESKKSVKKKRIAASKAASKKIHSLKKKLKELQRKDKARKEQLRREKLKGKSKLKKDKQEILRHKAIVKALSKKFKREDAKKKALALRAGIHNQLMMVFVRTGTLGRSFDRKARELAKKHRMLIREVYTIWFSP